MNDTAMQEQRACARRPRRRLRWAGLVFGLAVLMPALSASQTAEAIAWNAERSLTWSLYQGPPRPGDGAAAVTVYRLAYEEECRGSAFSFRVVSYFLSDKSWVKPDALTDGARSSRLLVHEQGHFDLSEVQARRLRRRLSELAAPCDLAKPAREAIVRRSLEDDAELQVRYDRETNYGLNDVSQARWSADIKRDLESLKAFADEGGTAQRPSVLAAPGIPLRFNSSATASSK